MKPWLPATTSETEGTTEVSADLAPAQPGSDLPRSVGWKWLAICFGVTFLVYASLIPRFVRYSSPPTGDQAFYLMVTMSIVQDGDLNIANNYANRDEDKFYKLAPHPLDFVGMGAPYPLPPHNALSTARPANEWYNFHLPGLSLAIAPAWVIGGIFSLWWPATVVFMCVIGAMVALNIFLLAYEMTGRIWIAVAVWLPISFSNPIMSYSYMIFTELAVGLLLLYAFRRLALGWGANGPFRLLLIGLCIGYIPWLSWRCIFIAAPLGLYALVQWWRYWRQTRRTASRDAFAEPSEPGTRHPRLARILLSALWVFVPVSVAAALLAWYHLFLYGSILQPEWSNEMGPAPLFKLPWAGIEEFTRFITHGFAMVLDRQMGLLTYAPIYLMSLVGMVAMFRSARRSDRRLLGWTFVVIGPYILMLMAYEYWNGIWNPPARFPATLVPLMAAPLAMSLHALSQRWLYKIIYAALGMMGIFFMSIMMYDARLMWPSEPVFRWLVQAPESPLRVDLMDSLPAFGPLDMDRLPMNTAWQFVAIGLIVLMFCRLIVPRPSVASQGIAWLGTAALLGSCWYVINHEYIRPRTVLTQQVRWNLQPEPVTPRGIEYMDGKIYVTAYDSAAVGVLDTSIQDNTSYSLIQPFIGGAAVTFARPAAIKVGPDNLLHILNNGPGEQAMYVIKPDGEFVGQVPLNGLSDIAAGLQFGPDGGMYIADLRGGRVRKYPVTGGNPIAEWGGMTGSFNNVVGIAVDDYGTIYAAESSNHRIQQLDPKGAFVRAFDLPCGPSYIAINGDWLDTTCGEEVISINKKTGGIQHSRVENGPEMRSPTGLVYGPDGTLYVSDGGAVIAYKVQH